MTCRYPIGDPLQPGFHFCDKPDEHKGYCLEHNKLCRRGEFERDPNWNGKRTKEFA